MNRFFLNFRLPALYNVTLYLVGKDKTEPINGLIESDAAYLNSASYLHEQIKTGTYFFQQVHGAHCENITKRISGNALYATADAGFTFLMNTPIGIRTADCLPILFWHKNEPLTGGIHAGWKGLHCGIIESSLTALLALGVNLRDICFFIGPCNGPDTYETGADVHALFPDTYLFPSGNTGKKMLDMPRLAKHMLEKKGVPQENIMHMNENVFLADQWYSHRKGDVGRNIALISSVSCTG